MPPRLSPTVRQKRLGIELRRMREHVGVTPKILAATIGTDLPKISQMENGKSGISAERLRIWARICECPEGPYLDALLAMTQDRRKYWWDSYRGRLPGGLVDIAEMEHHAQSLSIFNTTFIPGLLQTEAYAGAVFERLPPQARQDAEIRKAFRIRRQQLFTDQPKPYCAILHESALRMQFGGPEVLRDQLESVLTNSERPGLEIRVIPFSVPTYPGSGESSLYLARGPVPELDTVQIDLSNGPKFVHGHAELRTYRRIKEGTAATALGPEESRDFIRTILKDFS
ncbi:hypothetical protein VM98_13580 [Streptomyces rubellomurinus subsp. indigoferus]|nr:hypothetical protein VM98_13580 [Streptomyces rubellomurinus subsp. indigoferus]